MPVCKIELFYFSKFVNSPCSVSQVLVPVAELGVADVGKAVGLLVVPPVTKFMTKC